MEVEIDVEVEARMAYSAKVLERMVSQSQHWEVALDFRYWEDPADSYRCHQRTGRPNSLSSGTRREASCLSGHCTRRCPREASRWAGS